MAGNFWQSSHYLQWILDKQDLLKERQKDLKFLSEEEYWKLQIFFTNVIQALGEHLKLRQQVIATATVYFKRFYARYSLKSIDPVLMAPTCVFLASKVERETEYEWARGRERGKHRIRSRLLALSCQHRARRGARTHGP
uniref:Cyclin-like domain-containing protein n=1 Tax=Felis catus TaxID=9685 RepID=A0ABI7WV76_FELCA